MLGVLQLRTWTSGSSQSMWWNVCAQRLDLGLYSLQESTLVPENVWKTSYWETTFVCLLVALCPSNMLVYLRDRSAQTTAHAATLRQKMQIKLSISPSHSILILSWQVPVLTLKRHAPGKAGTGVPISKSPVWPDPPPPPSKKKHWASRIQTHSWGRRLYH